MASVVRLRLLAFASAIEALGADSVELELGEPPGGLTVAALKDELTARYPGLGGLWHRIAVAIDGEVAADEVKVPAGAEVALLPPVSGGAGDEAAPRVTLDEAPLDANAVAALIASPDCGALLLFVGTVRDHHQGRAVERITYSAYRPLALARLVRIVRELEAEHAGLRLSIAHRLGTIPVGAASVVIAAASPHRDTSYQANRRALERLKAEVPIWKREHYRGGGESWREEESLVPPVPTPTR